MRMIRSHYLPSKNNLFFVSQIFYPNFVIITKNLSTVVNRNIITYTTHMILGKCGKLNEIYAIFIVSDNMEKETN